MDNSDPSTNAGTSDATDPARFGQLMRANLPALRAFLRRRASRLVLARESVDDLVQSACRDVIEHADDGRFELRSDAEFKQWLYAAGLLKLRARARFHGAERRTPLREVGAVGGGSSDDPAFEPTTSATPSRLVANEEARAKVRAAIETLGERDRDVVRLVVLDGRSHAEVAQRLGLEVAHCRMVLSRAMAKLSARL